MSRRLSIKVDPSALSMARSIRAAAGASQMLVLTGRALGELAAELGSMDAAEGYVLAVAEEINKPIGVNFGTGAGCSRTVFFAPGAWSSERLSGWIAGKHRELEREFGEIAGLWAERGGAQNGVG